MATLRQETAQLCEQMLDTMQTGKTGIHQKTLNRLVKFIDQFKTLNFANDREMEELLEQTRRELLGRTAEEYLDSDAARVKLKAGLQGLAETRVVKLFNRSENAHKTELSLKARVRFSADIGPPNPPEIEKVLAALACLGYPRWMSLAFKPWHLFVLILSGWVNRRQQEIIDFQNAQIKALMDKLGRKRILLTDDQRRVLAVKGRAIGRKAMMELTTVVTPDTILRWHRRLVAKKWDYSKRRRASPGRPPMSDEVAALVLRMARENPTWGFDKIEGAIQNLGYEISDTTVGNILSEQGIKPAPDRKRKSTWKTFLKAHWDVLGAIDFTTIEIWTKGGLVTHYLLFVIELSTRRIQFAGCTTHPDEAWMKQAARNLTDPFDGFLMDTRYLLMDRDTKYCTDFRSILEQAGVSCVRLPPRSPNLNPHIERFIRSIKDECLSRMIYFGEDSIRRAVAQFLEHYHGERNHQGLGNEIIAPGDEVGQEIGEVRCRERVGGMLRYYYRDAA